MAEVHGTCDERFAGVRDALAAQLDGDELGASVAVDLDGETVVDVWGGHRDEERTTPWTQDTIVNGWSTTKCVLNLAALMLVERGELDLDAPVGDYWPEFSANGKKHVLVRHLMAHTSGLSGWEPPFTVRDMYDWPTATERLAQQRPWWEPGTAAGYHAATQGFLVGEVIRRITNKTFRKFVADEIAGPLGADFQVGARERDRDRIAPVVAPPREEPPADVDPASIAVRTFTAPVMSVKATTTPEWRAADLGALNGHSNARGLLDVLRVLSLGGTAGGVRLLSARTVERVFDVQADGTDLVLEAPFTWGIGYCLGSPAVPYVPAGRTFFWGGWGGSLAVMDLDRRLTITYLMNRMAPGLLGSTRSEAYVRAVYAALDS
ncbi:serine hydrolase domain-containing protein [Blastococcus tunisiensis]|uniref:CubicO group peptidase, beta-lactamase class C family n=1 Tax=Blastococcus tunisiensis TaxID=1798228 RepID=A0A1I2F7V3_9ACTN|nr:serine hydrolase domain-containing protein [Blastococcus sp. DSM 46838]SFF01504.1 CubicO group peptidase, beta-lactamase class C family [Blastococcus sp. DSM 46838]